MTRNASPCLAGFDKDFEKIMSAVDSKGSLRDGNMNLITKDTVQAMKRPLNDAPVGLFHNSFLMYNDLCLLQLRNSPKIQKLQELDDKLKQVTPLKDETPLKIRSVLVGSGEFAPEEFWEPKIQSHLQNNVYAIHPNSSEPTLTKWTSYILFGIPAVAGIAYWYWGSQKRN